jgi:hypothetical protein
VLIKDVLSNALAADKELRTDLAEQLRAFREHLIHDITFEAFADIYAETIAYGMFAARLHDTTLETFDRQEALDLLPKSNPFLRSLFGYIAGPDLGSPGAFTLTNFSANQQNETSATMTPIEDAATSKKVSNLEAAQAGRQFC